MDGDPRSYRVPVIRLSDVYADEEETGSDEPDAVAPWQRDETYAKPPRQAQPPQVPKRQEDEEQRVTQPIVTVEELQGSSDVASQTPPAPAPNMPAQTPVPATDTAVAGFPSFAGQTSSAPAGFAAPQDTVVPPEPAVESYTPPQALDDSVAPTILGEDLIQKLKQRKETYSYDDERPPEAPTNIWQKAQAAAEEGGSMPTPSFSFGEPIPTNDGGLASAGLPSDDLPDIWEQASARPAPAPPSQKKDSAPVGPSEPTTASPVSAPAIPSSFDPIAATDTPTPQTTPEWPAPESDTWQTRSSVPLEPTPEPIVPTPPPTTTPPEPQIPITPTPPVIPTPTPAPIPEDPQPPTPEPAERPAPQPAAPLKEDASSAPFGLHQTTPDPTTLVPKDDVQTEPTSKAAEVLPEEGVGTIAIRRAPPSTSPLDRTISTPPPKTIPPDPLSVPPSQPETIEPPHKEEPEPESPGVMSSVMKAFGVQDTEKESAPREEVTSTPPKAPENVQPPNTLEAETINKPAPTEELPKPEETDTDASGVMSSVMKAFGVPPTAEQEQRPPEVRKPRPRVIENLNADFLQERGMPTERGGSSSQDTPPSGRGMDGVRSTPSAKDILMQGVHTPKEDDPLDMWDDAARKPKRVATKPQPTPEPPTTPAAKSDEEEGSSLWGIKSPSAPTQTTKKTSDDLLDMWGDGGISTPETVALDSGSGASETTEPKDTDSLDEVSAARDSFTPLPDSNDIYVKGAKKKERTVEQPSLEKPAMGSSLSELRERVLKQSVQDKIPVKKPPTPDPEAEGKDEDISATHGLVSGRSGVGMSGTSTGGPETRHAKAIAGVAQELKDLGGQGAAAEKAHPSNIPKSHSSLPLVRTFRADVEAAVTQGKVSMVGMISAEEKRRSGGPTGATAQKVARSRLSAKAYIMLGAALVFLSTILLVAGVIAYMVWLRPYLGARAENMFAAERMIDYSIEGKNGVVVLAELAALRDGTQNTQGTMTEIRLYTTMGESGSVQERNRVSAPQFVSLIAPNAPPQLLGALQSEFVIGLHQTEKSQVFLILSLKDAQFGPARAGMTAWEQSMARDLSPLFGDFEQLRTTQTPTWFRETPQMQATSTATDTPALVAPPPAPRPPENPTFRDYSVANISGRAIVDSNGKAHLVWSATDQSTIIIVTDPATLRDIQMRRGIGY